MAISWSSYPSPLCWVLLFFDAAIVLYVAVFTLVALSHVIAMWFLRKEFVLAVRSPFLAMISGVAAVFNPPCLAIYRTIRYDHPRGLETFVYFPAQAVFTAAYIFRGCRLIAMYNPRFRHYRWAYLITKEGRAAVFLLGLFVAWQALAWYAAAKVGVATVADTLPLTGFLDNMVTIIASIALLGKLRKSRDLFHTSTEIVTVGGFAIVGVVLLWVAFAGAKLMPRWAQHYVLFAFLVVRFHTTLLVTNIMPVRDVLLQKVVVAGGTRTEKPRRVSSLPFVPWARSGSHRSNSSKVVVGMLVDGESIPESLESTIHCGEMVGPIQEIIDSSPLLEAFEKFCQRALCSEAISFLKEVFAFCEAVQDKETRKNEQFRHFASVVNKFIKIDAPFEVHISSDAKKMILRFLDKKSFKDIDKVRRSHIFNLAVEEVCRMLTNNVLGMFYKTTQYKVITGQPLSVVKEEGSDLRVVENIGQEAHARCTRRYR